MLPPLHWDGILAADCAVPPTRPHQYLQTHASCIHMLIPTSLLLQAELFEGSGQSPPKLPALNKL